MQIEGPTPGRNEWFLDYVLRSPKEAGKHLTAGWMAMNSLKEIYRGDEIKTCWETFGGMGAQALMAERLFNLRSHFVGEYSQDAVDHLQTVLPQKVTVRLEDAYKSNPASDLILLDFGDLTAWKTRDGEPHRLLLDRVFMKDPQAVVFTDIACRYLHLHKQRYESLLGSGSCESYETYLHALLGRLEGLYGYSLVAGYMDRWSTVMALVPSDFEPDGQLHLTPEFPKGLELM